MPTIAISRRKYLLILLTADVNILPSVNLSCILREYDWRRLIEMAIGREISITKEQILSAP